MEREDYMAALRADGAALAAAAEGNLDRAVVACPGWTVADLVWHVGDVHRFWAQMAGERVQDEARARGIEDPPRPADAGLAAWFLDGLDRLVTTLQDLDPATAIWTWSDQHDAGFIQRRVAQETAVHRWDGQEAAGRAEPIHAGLAADGIDEFLTVFVSGKTFDGLDLTVHLQSTDAPGEWTVRAGDGQLEVEPKQGQADVAVRGPASDLLLMLWRRAHPDGLEVYGDHAALAQFLERPGLE